MCIKYSLYGVEFHSKNGLIHTGKDGHPILICVAGPVDGIRRTGGDKEIRDSKERPLVSQVFHVNQNVALAGVILLHQVVQRLNIAIGTGIFTQVNQ